MSLYPPPEPLRTEVFTRLPDALRIAPGERACAWGEANRPGVHLDSFLEGPSFDRAGNLYLVDIPYGRVFRVSPAGEWAVVADYEGWPNGLKLHRDGWAGIADYRRGILRLDVASGASQPEPLLTTRVSEGFKGCNDLIFDRTGNLFFTDQGQTGMHDPTGRVYRLESGSGRLDCLVANGPSPNGLALSPAEDVLYVGMTRGNAVWRLPLRDGGAGTTKVGVFTALAGGVSGADGLAVDQEGRVFVCDAGNGCVWCFTERGRPVYRIDVCTGGPTVTNLAFGGPDNRRLHIVDSAQGAVVVAELDVPGLPLFSHA